MITRRTIVSLASDRVQELEREELVRLGETIRLPGFRPGKIPKQILQQRYGERARRAAAQKVVSEAIEELRRDGSLPSSIEVRENEVEITSTHLPSLPNFDPSTMHIDASGERAHRKQQVLDHLNVAYDFPIADQLVDREFAAIWAAAEAQSPFAEEDRNALAAELRPIAERRVRLGIVIMELARRAGLRASSPEELEDLVIDFLLGSDPNG